MTLLVMTTPFSLTQRPIYTLLDASIYLDCMVD